MITGCDMLEEGAAEGQVPRRIYHETELEPAIQLD
jgi:hypothetical protein